MDLEEVFREDPRVEKVYNYSKEKYQEADLAQHNWDHITGNLYRGLKIANTEEDVDYSVLIVSVLFHDIGVTEGGYENHEEKSVEIAERDLPDFGFSGEEIEEIVHCLKTVGEGAKSETIEAQICSDADKLVKAGLPSIFNYFRVQREFGRPLDEMLDDQSKHKNLKEAGFYTEKAKEIGKGGFQERIDFFKEFRERLKERPDLTATEEDLRNL